MSDPTTTGSVSTTVAPVPSVPTPPPAPPPVDNSALEQDPDFVALRQAHAEAALERGDPPPAPANPPAATEKPNAATPKPRRIVVPKDRLDEATARLKAMEDENLYLKGALAAKNGTVTPPPAPAAAPTQEPAAPTATGVAPATEAERQTRLAQVTALRAEQLALADQYDRGEISMREFKEKDAVYADAIQNIRETDLTQFVLSAIPRPQAPPIALADQRTLEEQLQALTVKYPWSAVLNAGEIDYLRKQAIAEADGRGQPFRSGPAETIRLRERIAQLAEKFGPDWYPGEDPRKILGQAPVVDPGKTSPTPTPPANPAPGNGNAALRLAASHPPDIHNMGGPGAGTGEITADRIEQMSTDEIEALPASVRARILTQGA